MTKAFGAADLAISASGSLAYVPGLASSAGGVAELVYANRAGAATSLDPPVTYNPSGNRAISLSPDGTRLALDVTSGSPDIWVKQLPSGPLSRLTFEGTGASRPTWTADGQSVLYLSQPDTSLPSVWRKRADGSAAAELVWRAPDGPIAEASLSASGEWLIYRVSTQDGGRDIFGVRPGRDTVPTPLLTGRFSEQGAALSPDGKWLAYASNESGRFEIFVRPFPNTGSGRWQISTQGGVAVRWSRSGRELFFEGVNGDFMAVPISPGATFAPGEPRRLFRVAGSFVQSNVVPFYDVIPGDSGFVMVRLAAVNATPGAGQVVVVDNWFTELKTKMGKK